MRVGPSMLNQPTSNDMRAESPAEKAEICS
jgi:hypothetical protein